MLHSRTVHNKTIPIHERALRLVYSDSVSSFDELIWMNRPFSIHNRTSKVEIYKIFQGFSRSIVKNIFHLSVNSLYNRRARNILLYIKLYCINSRIIKYGTETVSYLASQILSFASEIIKSSNSLDDFKSKIRQ